jgi:putative Mg2+ transporter-C (MgtC) family protein
VSALLADPVYRHTLVRLLTALAVGGLIGLERTYHGRAAGFRTHALVCLSTCVLMVVTAFGARWLPGMNGGSTMHTTVDPTRMAQGIMTGIGFLGAGTILREGLSVRGLTTAASIWATAAIGILIGLGAFFPALVAAVLALGTLSVFRFIERKVPTQFNAHLRVCFRREGAPDEAALRRLLTEHGVRISSVHLHLHVEQRFLEYQGAIQARNADRTRRLTEALSAMETLRELQITPSGD